MEEKNLKHRKDEVSHSSHCEHCGNQETHHEHHEHEDAKRVGEKNFTHKSHQHIHQHSQEVEGCCKGKEDLQSAKSCCNAGERENQVQSCSFCGNTWGTMDTMSTWWRILKRGSSYPPH